MIMFVTCTQQSQRIITGNYPQEKVLATDIKEHSKKPRFKGTSLVFFLLLLYLFFATFLNTMLSLCHLMIEVKKIQEIGHTNIKFYTNKNGGEIRMDKIFEVRRLIMDFPLNNLNAI